MGQPGSGDKRMNSQDVKGNPLEEPQKSLIIDETSKRNKLLVVLEWLVSVIGTILVWCFLVWDIYEKLFSGQYTGSMSMLILLLFVILVIVLVGGVWQFYNWYMFHGKDRRQKFPKQSIAEVGNLYGISQPNMEELQSIRQAAVIQFKNHKYYYCVAGEPPIEIGMLREK